MGKTSYTLNGFPINKKEFVTGDFFSVIKQFKNDNKRFDIIVLDPPFFSKTGKGKVDLAEDISRLINRLRPLVTEGGKLIAINNALFVPGKDYEQEIKDLARSFDEEARRMNDILNAI